MTTLEKVREMKAYYEQEVEKSRHKYNTLIEAGAVEAYRTFINELTVIECELMRSNRND